MVKTQSCWKTGLCLLLVAAAVVPAEAATWTLVNAAPSSAGVMMLLTDGTVMIQQGYSGQGWMRLTPDAAGNYANGSWAANPISPMLARRLYFASNVLPSGKVFVLGGEYTGANLDANWSPAGEIYDPVANTWTAIANYPNQAGCPNSGVSSPAATTTGSNIIAGIATTARFVIGWRVFGTGIPVNTTVTSIDSPSQVHVSANATATGTATITFQGVPVSCYGDVPTMLLSGGRILAGNLINNSSFIYTPGTNTWTPAANKFYSDSSDEEGWIKLPGDNILAYDLFKSVSDGTGFAEVYNPTANLWSSKSPADGSALGTLPLLSSSALGYELGPGLRLLDGRVLIIGANNLTGLYNPTTNTWAAGPNISGNLNGNAAPFGGDDASAAILPNGHVIFSADAGPAAVTSSGNTTAGSNIVTDIPSTATFQVGWSVKQVPSGNTVIPANTNISSVDSPTQIHISKNALQTVAGQGLLFGGTFAAPTQLFDFNPAGGGSISPVAPAIPDASLNTSPAFVTRMLMLPTGQMLFADGTAQLYIYTPDGAPSPFYRPVISGMTYNGSGVFTLTGKQLNGQSAGASYGDDVEMDENYPVLRLIAANGNVYYCRTTNWSTTGVATGSLVETVNFTLNASMPAGNYSAIVSGAGIASFPVAIGISQAQVNGQ